MCFYQQIMGGVVSADSYDRTTAAKYRSSMHNNNEKQNVKLVFADGTGGSFRLEMEDRI